MSPPEDVLEISVGGKVFSCRRSTLRFEKDSLLSKMFDPDSKFGDLARDQSGRPFIDRDGEIFVTILKYLRNSGSITRLHEYSELDLAELLEEAEYYSLQNLITIIQNELKERRDVEERKRKDRETEEYQKEKKRIRKEWGWDYDPDGGQQCYSFTCDPSENVGKRINKITTLAENPSGDIHEDYQVHSVTPILDKGTTVKLCVLLTGSELVPVDGPTPEEQEFL